MLCLLFFLRYYETGILLKQKMEIIINNVLRIDEIASLYFQINAFTAQLLLDQCMKDVLNTCLNINVGSLDINLIFLEVS